MTSKTSQWGVKVDASQKSRPGPSVCSATPKLCDPGHATFSSLSFHVCKRRIIPPLSWGAGEIRWEYVCEVLSPGQPEEVLQNCDALWLIWSYPAAVFFSCKYLLAWWSQTVGEDVQWHQSLTPITDTLEDGEWTQLAVCSLPSPWCLTQGPGCFFCWLQASPKLHSECCLLCWGSLINLFPLSPMETHSPSCWLIYLLFTYLFSLFLAASGLSCGTRDPRWGRQDLSLRRVGSSLVVACGFSLL